ncbi:hypothetical protein BDW72DRAFT_199503 [Aspergillus terricola var. indicus]
MPGAIDSSPSEWLQLELRRICANVLQLDIKDVDPQRSFLSLGGDSLLAIKILAQCRAQGITINIADIMAATTLESLYAMAQGPAEFASSSTSEKDSDKDSSLNDSETGALTPTTDAGSSLADTLSSEMEAKLSALSMSQDAAIQAIVPCSAIQDRMLVSQLQNPHLYSCCFVLRFTHSHPGLPIDAKRLGRAWGEVVKRHSSLRTVLVESTQRPGHYNQVILAGITPAVEYHEGAHHLSSVEFNVNNRIVFEPHSIPHRLQLVQVSPSEVHLKFDISHLLIDGQSAEVLLRDLSDAYHDGELTAAPLSYADYVSSYLLEPSQRNNSRETSMEMSPLTVPMDRPNEGLLDFQTVGANVPLDSQLVQSLCARYSVTLATVCQLAWGLVLRCYAGTDSVCFSYVNSGRSMSIPGVQEVIGPIVQTSMCSIQLGGADELSKILQHIHKDALQAMSQLSPLEANSTSRSARQLSNTTMSFQRVLDDAAVQRAGLSVKIEGKANPTDYDISLGIAAGADGLSIDLDYWGSRLDEESAKTMLGAFEAAIRGIIDSPTSTVSDISLLSPGDVAQLAQWNASTPKPERVCVHDKIMEISKLQPGAAAVNSWDGDLTYHDLAVQASTLAHHLRNQLGVGPEKFVGICMDKSKWAIISMLAVLMAGGIVVPLGVSHPRARIKGLLTDTAAVALLVDGKHGDRLANLAVENAAMLTVDQQLLSSLSTIPEPPVSGVTPDNAAWVIYTSGSTGVPKGVVLLHQNISTSVIAHGAVFGVNCVTRTAQFAAYTFDVSLSDIVMTLFHGGCVCVFSEESRMNNLTEALQGLAVNYVNLTPTVLGLLNPAELPKIRTVVAGGEAMDPGIIEKWSPHARVFNSVGPSECTIIAVAAGPILDPAQAANVGYPTGTRLWVALSTDPNQLCPVGVPGELLIEGPMLSRGYLNDPEKTAGAFIMNPAFIKHFEAANHAWGVQFQGSERRLYRSGDLVRQNRDGSLVHMGRRDTQVKIRGQRVEIGEIEYWIMQRLKEVQRVAVLVVERGQGKEQKSLVAAIEFKEGNEFFRHVDDIYPVVKTGEPAALPQLLPLTEPMSKALHQLRNDLLEHLPPYMSPTMYAPISQLPLNLSGKIDRRAVTQFINELDDAKLQQYLAVGGSHQEPSTQTESKLQKLWAKTLGVDISQVSADSHFFHIGGDSVAAMRVVAAARDVELVLRVADIFEYPRLLDLARAVESRVVEIDEEDPVPFSVWRKSCGSEPSVEGDELAKIAGMCSLSKEQIEDVLPCTALQEGLIALTAQQPTAYIDRQVFALSHEVDLSQFRAAWQVVIQRTSTLRTRIVSGPQTGSLQVVVVPSQVEWSESSSLDEYLESDRQMGMTMGQSLNRFSLVDQPDGRRFFVWTTHHSTYDGWSRGLVLQQVAHAYTGRNLPPIASFSRFIRYLQSQPQDAAASYWKAQLCGDTSADFPALPNANYRPRPQQRHQHTVSLASSSTTAMLPDLLRGAWALVVHQYVGKTDPVFAVALSGRNAPVQSMTNIAGPTLTTVPVRVPIDPERPVNEFLQSVRQQAVDMIPYEHTGLQRIRKMVPELAAAVDLKHLFVVQPASDSESKFEIPGVTEHPVAVDEFDSYGLNVECTLSGQSVEVDVRFDENLLSPSQIRRLMSQFESVVQQLNLHGQGSLKIKDIDLLSPEDVNQIWQWNALPLAEPLDVCLHDLIAEVARCRPGAAAIEAWDGTLTHAQLQSYASTLAGHLVGLGVGPEISVPVCMDKSVWAVVCFLAVLQAGGVVVPLGTGHPVPRIASIIQDINAKLVLVDVQQSERLAELTSSRDLSLLPIDAQLLNSLPTATPQTSVTPANAAWIVFTSGSTGKAKGVVLTHSNLSTAVKTHGARFGLGTHTRTVQFAAHTFDAVLQDYFTTLASGGTVCVPSEADRMSNLAGVIRDMNVNFANLTSTVARLVAPEQVPSLKLLVLAGEQIQDAVVETWYKHAEVMNVYGPTECSINSTCNGPISDLADAQSIGFGMGSRTWIADPTDPNRLCPVGTPGELLIEGPGLARGYLGDPAKTEAAIIQNPSFASRFALSDCRVYRTGDLAKQTEDGQILYLGRIDTQIKIRGQRVEVAEIEHWIGYHLPHVKHTAVVAISRGENQMRLAAVIEFENGRKPDPAVFTQLKKTLTSLLPFYMVPGLYIPVTDISLTVSGKLDRRAIKQMIEDMPAEDLGQYFAGESSGTRVPPSTEMEKALQRIWANALGVELDTIGAEDDFFRLGGDSVVAMHISASSRQDQSVKGLAVGDIFMHPRLSDLAAFLEKREQEVEGGWYEEKTGDDESPFALLQEALELDLEDV